MSSEGVLLHPQLTASLINLLIDGCSDLGLFEALEDEPLFDELLKGSTELVQRQLGMSQVQILKVLFRQLLEPLATECKQVIGHGPFRGHDMHAVQSQYTTGVTEDMPEGCGEATGHNDVTNFERGDLAKDAINHCRSLRSIRPVGAERSKPTDIPKVAGSAYCRHAPPAQDMSGVGRLE